MTELPIGARPVCINCGNPFDPNPAMILRVLRGGLVQPRKGGGVHHVIGPEYTGELVGQCCFSKVRLHGGLTRQESLL